jgi:hypothetical protein
MFAYLDASDDVVATSTTEYTLAEAQALVPTIDTIISDAPKQLVAKGEVTARQPPYWHRHTSGDGSSITDYTEYPLYGKYTYSVSGDTADGVVSVDRLTEEIEASAIAETLAYIKVENDDLEIYFDTTLSSGDETILDGLVAAHTGHELRDWTAVVVDPVMEPVLPAASKVVANDRPAIEVSAGATGFAAMQGVWHLAQSSDAQLRATMKFILKATGTGSNVRIAARLKSHGTGDDSSGTWDASGFTAVAVTHTTLGEIFEGVVTLDASDASDHDAVALQVGRDGNNELGAGTNDDVDQTIQIIALEVEAR